MPLIVHPTARLFWIPNSVNPSALGFFINGTKRVIESVTKAEVNEITQLARGTLGLGRTRALYELQQYGVVYHSVSAQGFDFSGRNSRQVVALCNHLPFDLAIAVQSALEKLTAVIIGLGGAGCNVVLQLLGLGISRFVLVDPDVIESSNLNRQILYSPRDIGRAKVDAAADYIYRSIDDTANLRTYRQRLIDFTMPPEVNAKSTIVVVSADDTPQAIRIEVARRFYPLEMPYAFLGYSGGTARVGPMIFSRINGCGSCHLVKFGGSLNWEPVRGTACSNIAPSSLMVNSMLSSLYAYELARWMSRSFQPKGLNEEESNYVIEFNEHTLSSSRTQRQPLAGCEICGG